MSAAGMEQAIVDMLKAYKDFIIILDLCEDTQQNQDQPDSPPSNIETLITKIDSILQSLILFDKNKTIFYQNL